MRKAHCIHTKMIKNNDIGNNNIDNIKKIKMVETHIYGRPNGRMSREN